MATGEFDYMSGEQFLEEILRQAIRFEEESYDLYSGAARKAIRSEARLMLEELARQELGHKKRLQQLQEEGVAEVAATVNVPRVESLYEQIVYQEF